MHCSPDCLLSSGVVVEIEFRLLDVILNYYFIAEVVQAQPEVDLLVSLLRNYNDDVIMTDADADGDDVLPPRTQPEAELQPQPAPQPALLREPEPEPKLEPEPEPQRAPEAEPEREAQREPAEPRAVAPQPEEQPPPHSLEVLEALKNELPISMKELAVKLGQAIGEKGSPEELRKAIRDCPALPMDTFGLETLKSAVLHGRTEFIKNVFTLTKRLSVEGRQGVIIEIREANWIYLMSPQELARLIGRSASANMTELFSPYFGDCESPFLDRDYSFLVGVIENGNLEYFKQVCPLDLLAQHLECFGRTMGGKLEHLEFLRNERAIRLVEGESKLGHLSINAVFQGVSDVAAFERLLDYAIGLGLDCSTPDIAMKALSLGQRAMDHFARYYRNVWRRPKVNNGGHVIQLATLHGEVELATRLINANRIELAHSIRRYLSSGAQILLPCDINSGLANFLEVIRFLLSERIPGFLLNNALRLDSFIGEAPKVSAETFFSCPNVLSFVRLLRQHKGHLTFESILELIQYTPSENVGALCEFLGEEIATWSMELIAHESFAFIKSLVLRKCVDWDSLAALFKRNGLNFGALDLVALVKIMASENHSPKRITDTIKILWHHGSSALTVTDGNALCAHYIMINKLEIFYALGLPFDRGVYQQITNAVLATGRTRQNLFMILGFVSSAIPSLWERGAGVPIGALWHLFRVFGYSLRTMTVGHKRDPFYDGGI